MSGEELKNIFKKNDIVLGNVCDQLEVSQAAFSQMLKVQSVKTDLLERICKILHVNMTFFYPVEGIPEQVPVCVPAVLEKEREKYKKLYEEEREKNLSLEGKYEGLNTAYTILLDRVAKTNIE